MSADIGKADVKRQKVTVGMYNTYSIKDGNLGRVEPDLKEVWEGLTSVSDFESCNMTMHYWPRPFDLPEVEPGKNPYSAWWISYMEEAYNLTNQKGEVRLQVIVGPLYSFYATYKGEFFDEFISDLCKWDKESPCKGTLAGWYLSEEPMGSTHNYDPDVQSEMVKAIKAVEKSLGVPDHKTYIDVAMEGLYYTSSGLIAFTRQADVVMISSSTYLWTTSGKQPVYEPNWNSIHGPMKIARDLIYPDRDRRKQPRPEIHAVLEARDAIGHGQPTNWEMRQQINLALSQSLIHNDPPADGVWFFWWSEIGRNAKDNSDDWNYGRRLAEAIQTQVARSTLADSPWVRKSCDPEKTRFRFPESGSFNPANSCIPYDLAEPGYVRIEILSEKKSRVKEYNMKYQVAGSLPRFGGPYWYRENAPNGTYIFLLYLNSKLMDEVKVKVQWSIMVNSASHQPGVWSNNNKAEVQWEPQPEEESGVSGYSFLWDTSPYSYPDDREDLPSAAASLSSPLPDGNSNYFHIISLGESGIYWDSAAHLGPFYIDTTEPGNVIDIASDSHETGKWSKKNRIIVHWNPAEDGSSGIKGYSVAWDSAPGTLPDDRIDIPGDATMLASEPLDDGRYYLHIRSVDKAGNWSRTSAHIGPFLIDTSPPMNIPNLISNSHTAGQWSNKNIITVSWKTAEDTGGGVSGYSALWDSSASTIPGEKINIDGRITSSASLSLKSSKAGVYFHIRSVDMSGNWAVDAQHIGPFMIDTEPPSKIESLVSTSHKPEQWSRQTSADITWNAGTDDASGITGYEWSINANGYKPVSAPPLNIYMPGSGLWQISVRAIDSAGNPGSPEQINLKVDSEPPDPPDIQSSTHPDNRTWFTSSDVTLKWTAEDNLSGLSGCNWSWDKEEMTIPAEQSSDLISTIQLISASPGVWYFHLRVADSAGNWSKTSHYRVPIDPSAPPAPQIFSDIYRSGEWTTIKDIKLIWETPSPGPSGIAGYSCLLDQNSSSIPGEIITSHIETIGYSDLPDGLWYFHCRAKSGSSLWGQTSHFQIKIDTTPPDIRITYPEHDRWYDSPITEYSGTAEDSASGIDWSRLFYQYNEGENWLPFQSDVTQGAVWTDKDEIPHSGEGNIRLRVMAYDAAGNRAVSDPINIRVDQSASIPIISSWTHPDQNKWYRDKSPAFAWRFTDSYSGADSCNWAIDRTESTILTQISITDVTYTNDVKNLADGVWYFHVRGKDKAGNWSETAHYRVKIDSTPPTAQLKISGPAVINGNHPLAKAGTVEVVLKTSEPVSEPSLKYKTASAAIPVPVELKGVSSEWVGAFDITLRTGDGEAVFFFSARDEAGNTGNEVIAGGSFMVDTLIHSDLGESAEVLCVNEPGTRIIIPPDAITQDMRIEIAKGTSAPGMIAVYDFIVYDPQMKRLKNFIFKKPVRITFSTKNDPSMIGVCFWDGIRWHKVQNSCVNVMVDHSGRFGLISSKPMRGEIMNGWAAPNPFIPEKNGTIFHAAAKNGLVDFNVRIYDINGRQIKCLEYGKRAWDGTNDKGSIVEGGLYIYQIDTGSQIISGTVVVLR